MTSLANKWSKAQIAAMTSLLALCAALSAVAYGAWQAPIGRETALPPVITKGTAATGTEARAPDALPPLSRFSEVTERPLFQQDRRGMVGAGGGSAAFTDLTLAGVIVTPDTRQALIAHGDPAEVVYRREGQSIGGWMLTSIQSDRVVVRNGPEMHELRLIQPATTTAETGDDGLPERPRPRGR